MARTDMGAIASDHRELLSAAIFQYSMSTQHQRQRASEQILLTILLEQSHDQPMTVINLALGYKRLVRGVYVSHDKLREVLNGLAIRGEVEITDADESQFRLSEPCRTRLEREREQWRYSVGTLTATLFDSPQGLTSHYEQPFLEFISEIALTAGTESASYLINQTPNESVESKLNDKMVSSILDRYPTIDRDRFRAGIYKFFQSSDPAVNGLLWRATELGFSLRLLGADRPSSELATVTFEHTAFILDTNVLIPYFLSQDENHDHAAFLLKALKSIGSEIVVTDLTIYEMEGVLDRDYAILKNAVAKGSVSLLSKLDSPFLREYADIWWRSTARHILREVCKSSIPA